MPTSASKTRHKGTTIDLTTPERPRLTSFFTKTSSSASSAASSLFDATNVDSGPPSPPSPCPSPPGKPMLDYGKLSQIPSTRINSRLKRNYRSSRIASTQSSTLLSSTNEQVETTICKTKHTSCSDSHQKISDFDKPFSNVSLDKIASPAPSCIPRITSKVEVIDLTLDPHQPMISESFDDMESGFDKAPPTCSVADLQVPNQERCNIDFRQHRKTKSGQKLNEDIWEYLTNTKRRARPRKNPRYPDKEEFGFVYVFSMTSHSLDTVKIGKTLWNHSGRKDTLEKDCRFILSNVDDTFEDAFSNYHLVERLVHLSLHNVRKEYLCLGCNERKVHNEWFDINHQTAIATVNMWRSWTINHRPFNENRHLTAFWKWKADKARPILSKIDWNEWTNPSMFEHIAFLICSCQKPFSEYFSIAQAHFSRKDLRFFLVGSIITLLVFINFGHNGAIWSVIALCLL